MGPGLIQLHQPSPFSRCLYEYLQSEEVPLPCLARLMPRWHTESHSVALTLPPIGSVDASDPPAALSSASQLPSTQHMKLRSWKFQVGQFLGSPSKVEGLLNNFVSTKFVTAKTGLLPAVCKLPALEPATPEIQHCCCRCRRRRRSPNHMPQLPYELGKISGCPQRLSDALQLLNYP